MAKTSIRTIWAKISADDRRAIVAEIVTRGGLSVWTAYKWLSGVRTPLPLYQSMIAEIISLRTGKDYKAADLFPEN